VNVCVCVCVCVDVWMGERVCASADPWARGTACYARVSYCRSDPSHVHAHTHTCVRAHTRTHTLTVTHTRTHACARTHTPTQTRTHTRTHTHTHTKSAKHTTRYTLRARRACTRAAHAHAEPPSRCCAERRRMTAHRALPAGLACAIRCRRMPTRGPGRHRRCRLMPAD
jgi:hypothetical protein